MELSAKTKIYFATAVAMWDAEFYVKVDDDIHVNLGKLLLIDGSFVEKQEVNCNENNSLTNNCACYISHISPVSSSSSAVNFPQRHWEQL